MSFAAYQAYKSSQVPLVPNVPAHWSVAALRHLGRLLKGTGGSKEDTTQEGVPCVRYGDLYTTHTHFITRARSFVSAERADAYTPIQYGDVLFAGSGETFEDIGKSAANLMPSRAVCGGDLIILRPTGDISAAFLGYACDSLPSAAQKSAMGRGTTVKHIYPDELRHLLLPLPPIQEQHAIAAFLDRETTKIDALVAEQERLIELLKEKRHAVISHAVTEGLNADAPMKDSGIPWIGEIPVHWSLERGRFLYHKVELQPEPDDGVVTAFRDGQVILREKRRTDGFTVAVLEVGYQRVREGDLVIHGMDAFAGAIGVSESTGKCTPEYSVLSPSRGDLVNKYFALTLRLMALRGYVLVICPSVRERAPRFRFEAFKDVLLPVPPEHEQQKILEHISHEDGRLSALLSQAEHAIELLQERRSALVSAAVTGQIDVRAAAERSAA